MRESPSSCLEDLCERAIAKAKIEKIIGKSNLYFKESPKSLEAILVVIDDAGTFRVLFDNIEIFKGNSASKALYMLILTIVVFEFTFPQMSKAMKTLINL